ncbi:hypothetical protein PRK78_004341 [Emydomyces testavorans]|uniref:Restriction of telomere capping protein 4 n=1 Tax=Emydomyces testavorans TaxID=2070801 RepID=A0AAF0IJ62_9EURO|nr:hypothetical protein PRK78_004341 [Emydomyces testavorans]
MVVLTKTNHCGSPLLSQIGGRSTKVRTRQMVDKDDSSDDPLSMSKVSPTKRRRKEKPEPATDDSPMSSSDESAQLSRSSATPEPRPRERPTWRPEDLEADLDAESTPKPRKKPVSTPKTGQRRSQRTARANTMSKATNAGKDESRGPSWTNHDIGESLAYFRHSAKRRITYGSKQLQNIHIFSKEEKKHEFVMPPGDVDNSTTQPSETTTVQHEFKFPTAIPNDTFSSSSIPTNSSHEIVENLIFDADDRSGSLSPLSSVASEKRDLTADEKRYIDSPDDFIRCPACRELLDPEYLTVFQLEKGLSFSKQLQVCQEHKRWTAERDWRLREYPIIDWDALEQRLEKYFAELDQILTRKKPSFFRNSLECSNDGNTKKDNFRLTANSNFDMMSSGYYGPRGSKKMTDAIISKFASKIRHLAPSDSLMQAAGVSGFIQAVLVPELTVMLVKEDMGVGDEKARQIMRESTAIGDLLNEQPDDIITVNDEDGNIQS